ncbi:LysR family carnitine catabolism transcriptional activator [Oceanisphaera litoralis]|uniref:LysR family transcriptional regulator n=1 Tax=Oceanisphaera litoralis TaxID=225144 RepID=UPI00195C60A7|nr:LysR family transcriptional regulator [Oceanisphaera litoralis]MBM7455805.1 LysR family carnitine catabolism transcriptional activator [Oceanisphaera litoralis]
MTVKQLRAFLAVAQTLNFAQAGERLFLSQSALSLTIKGLEDDLGGRLLIRTTRQVRLTPEGEALLPLARRLLVEWDNTEDELRQRFTLQRGRVVLAAMPAFAGNLLPPLLGEFRTRHPGINVTISDVINEQVIDLVREGHVELGITFEPAADSGLAFTPLYRDRFVAVVPDGSPLAQYQALSWRQLLEQPFIALQRPSAVRLMLEQQLRQQKLTLPVAFESHQLTTIGRMVGCGLGVSVVPALCIKQMHELGAHCVRLKDPVIAQAVGMVARADHELSVAAQALYDILLNSPMPEP